MYSKTANKIKLGMAVVLPIAFNYLNVFILSDMISQLIAIVVCAFIYLIPFYFTVFFIKNSRMESIKGCFLKDIIFLLLPAAVSSIISEAIFSVIAKNVLYVGLISAILIGVFFFITLFGQLLYLIYYKIYKA